MIKFGKTAVELRYNEPRYDEFPSNYDKFKSRDFSTFLNSDTTKSRYNEKKSLFRAIRYVGVLLNTILMTLTESWDFD